MWLYPLSLWHDDNGGAVLEILSSAGITPTYEEMLAMDRFTGVRWETGLIPLMALPSVCMRN
jgi:hypothetical protein